MKKLTQAQLAEKLAGTPTRFTPAKCHRWVDTGEMEVRYDGAAPSPKQEWRAVPMEDCQHAAGHHDPSGQGVVPDSISRLGLRRNKAGAFEYTKPAKLSENGRDLSATMRENIAACAAFGLSYWSDAPGAGNVYAVDEWQQAHILKIDRKAGKVEGDYDGRDAYGYRVRYRFETYAVPSTQELLFGEVA